MFETGLDWCLCIVKRELAWNFFFFFGKMRTCIADLTCVKDKNFIILIQ